MGCTRTTARVIGEIEEFIRVGWGSAAWFGAYSIAKVFNHGEEFYSGSDIDAAALGAFILVVSMSKYSLKRLVRPTRDTFCGRLSAGCFASSRTIVDDSLDDVEAQRVTPEGNHHANSDDEDVRCLLPAIDIYEACDVAAGPRQKSP